MKTKTKRLNKRSSQTSVSLSALSDPEDPVWAALCLGGGGTASGETVGPTTALRLSVYFACIRNISEDVGKLPVMVYEDMPDGTKRRERDNPIWELLGEKPNSEMSAMTFRETLTHHALGWGNGYAEIVRNVAGEAIELWPITPERVKPFRAADRSLWFQVQSAATSGYREPNYVPAADMLHIHGLGYDGCGGYSVASYAKESIGSGLALDKYGASFFGNGALPGAVLEHPASLSPKALQNLRKSWEEMHKGAGNAHKAAILEEGMKLNKISVNPNDAQFIESKQHTVEDICRWFRMPPHMVQHLLRATFANIEHQGIEYVKFTLEAWLQRWEQEVKRKLLGSGNYYFEHNINGLLRGDTQSRYAAYAVGRQWGWMSANDIRRLENLDPIDGGDVYLSPQNMTPADRLNDVIDAQIAGKQTGSQPNNNPNAPDPTANARTLESLRQPLVAAIKTLLQKESDRAKAAAKKPDKFNAWLDEFYSEHRTYAIGKIVPCVVSWNAVAADYGGHYVNAADIADAHCKRTHGELLEASGTATVATIEPTIERLTSEWTETRAAEFARQITGG